MQVTSLLSRDEQGHTHDESCASCGQEHEHTPVRLQQTILGLIFVLNSFVVDWVFGKGSTVADFSAMIGAIILGYPIVWTSLKDLRRGILSTNELVGLAVIAAFSSGNYQEAGLVAFFMLLGEIIETRTADGARASIESLIKLTPTKARRIQRAASVSLAEKEEEVATKD
ncbi:MAG: hypothetical protein ABIR24_05870, partial [Verrucomicrobiota bacterium]